MHWPVETIYHTPGWRDLMEEVFGFEYLEIGSGDAILPLYTGRALSGKFAISIPQFIYCGTRCESPERAAELVDEAMEVVRRGEADYLLIKERKEITGIDLEKKVHEYTFYIDLSRGRDAIWKGLPQKSVKWPVNKARRSGLGVRHGGDIEDVRIFYEMYRRTRRGLGVPGYSSRFFEKLWEKFSREKIDLIFAVCENTDIAGILLYHHAGQTYYAQAAALPGSPARRFQAHDFLLWEGIERAVERGDSVFDLHGATRGTEGIFKFKEKWADEVVELPYYFYRRDGKDLPYIDPGSARLDTMKKIWRRLPLFLTERFSEVILRKVVR
jgi:predicted RNase H-like HicB family nuclease